MTKEFKAIKKHSIRILNIPAVTESGVYDAVFTVNGEVVEREFEVGINATYDYEDDTNYFHLKGVIITVICCNEDDEDIADIMERKIEEAIENYMWSK